MSLFESKFAQKYLDKITSTKIRIPVALSIPSLLPIKLTWTTMTQDTSGGFVTSPKSSFIPSTPTPTDTNFGSPPAQPPTRPITSREELLLIATLDDQITTISSRFTRRYFTLSSHSNPRHQDGGYTSLKRLSKDYHHLLQTLLHHSPPAKPFMTCQYLIRIVGDLNEQLPALPVPQDPRGIFYILKELDNAIVANLSQNGGMSQTERVRLRGELERGRGIVAGTFEDYNGSYSVEEAIGKVYERSLEEMDEPFILGDMEGGLAGMDSDIDDEKLQEGVTDDGDVS